jgi:uncharacterized protein YjiS (DUF1127 family)
MTSILNAALSHLRNWRERQHVINELYAMDDRMLADIGLNRSDIPFIRLDAPVAQTPVIQPSLTAAANESHRRAA